MAERIKHAVVRQDSIGCHQVAGHGWIEIGVAGLVGL
jgi:hypothetical protein